MAQMEILASQTGKKFELCDCELGKLICEQGPYGDMTLLQGWQNQVEWEARPVVWSFRDVGRRVNKAFRIPVQVTVKNERTGNMETYLDWLLVGYEGANGA